MVSKTFDAYLKIILANSFKLTKRTPHSFPSLKPQNCKTGEAEEYSESKAWNLEKVRRVGQASEEPVQLHELGFRPKKGE